MSDTVLKNQKPHSSWPPRHYGLPKRCKTGAPLRPIVSTIGAPNYGFARHLPDILAHFVGQCQNHIKNAMNFVEVVDMLNVSPIDLMVNVELDSVSLFTCVHLKDTMELLKPLFTPEFLDLFHLVLFSYFLYEKQFYNKVDGGRYGLSFVSCNS